MVDGNKKETKEEFNIANSSSDRLGYLGMGFGLLLLERFLETNTLILVVPGLLMILRSLYYLLFKPIVEK